MKQLLTDFEGTGNFEAWQSQLLHLREVFKVDDEKLNFVVRLKLKSVALSWYNSNKMYLRSLDDVLKEMATVFGQDDNLLVVRRRFEKRCWKSSESFGNYYYEKCLLASGLNLNDTELVEYLVDGIPNKQLQIQAKLQNFKTASEIVKAFRTIELPHTSNVRPVEEHTA